MVLDMSILQWSRRAAGLIFPRTLDLPISTSGLRGSTDQGTGRAYPTSSGSSIHTVKGKGSMARDGEQTWSVGLIVSPD
jgi:hypothetical protein